MYRKNVTRTHQIDGNCNTHLWVLNYLKLERNERDKRSLCGQHRLQEQLEGLKAELEARDADVEQ